MSASRAAGGDFDLTQFYGVFFEEAGENLDTFEQLLLALDVAHPADDTLHAIFRCAHSVKGGAATFGFADVAALTHAMETLLDRLRRHEQKTTAAMVDTLLAAGDALREQLRCHQQGGAPAPDTGALLAALASHGGEGAADPASGSPAYALFEEAPAQAPAARAPAPAPAQPAATSGERDLEMLVSPPYAKSLAEDLVELFGEVSGGGKLEMAPLLPAQPQDALRFRLRTTASDGDILDLCSFHADREQIALSGWPSAGASSSPAPAATPAVTAPAQAPAVPSMLQAAPASAASVAARSAAPTETLRVAVDKVDQLINLMGELVITQAMLAQRASKLEPAARQELAGGLTDLERTTRDLQESVMAIRMIPMSDVFNRFPRMLRDLASRLGKKVDFQTVGEATEMDKGLIEKITDPLTHLVRNSVDHGIEMPADRRARGKPEQGTLTLAARHEGGCIVIEVSDDGRGLDRARILDKARRNGMQLPESMSDSDVYQLIFAPGFSTAEAVTDISGRGVGMDVVRRNILALGGSVELDSTLGRGTCVRVRLPLTLAIMDGMSVSVQDELYLLPLASVVESFQATAGTVKSMPGGNRVVRVRDDWLPVVSLAQLMGAEDDRAAEPMLVVIQAEGRRIALQIERLVGQQQVVVKNLESNYRKVPGVSGATIMGDGSVALILDVSLVVRGAHALHSSLAAASRNTGTETGPNTRVAHAPTIH